ncbi:MAG: DUF29 family protein [Spirosomataceae bacterium]
MKTDWQELVSESYYQTISSIEEKIKLYDNEDALLGLHYLYDNMAKKDKREFQSFLILAMMHIIKWNIQPHKKSRSWLNTIYNARDEMEILQKDVPSITKEYIRSIWDESVEKANVKAKRETGLRFDMQNLTWQDVFEKEYTLEEDND